MRAFIVTLLVAFALVVSPVSAQNLLGDPGFEGPAPLSTDWQAFGNAFPITSNPPVDTTNTGSGALKMFGNFNPTFDVTGCFQTFLCQPGDQFELSCFVRHFSGDPITGVGMPSDNWCVQKIVFFDINNTEIAGASVESVILDGTFPTDTWMATTPIQATAPVGATSVQSFVQFLQPSTDGGAGYFDDVSFVQLNVSASYPGTMDDLILATGLNGAPDLFDIKTAMGGEFLTVNISSPQSIFDLQPYFVLAQAFPTLNGFVTVPGIPELYLDLNLPVFALVDPTVATPVGPIIIAPGGGTTTVYGIPPALAGTGTSISLQGLIVSNLAVNTLYATTNAHEIRVP